jgi:hypothetical protein
MDNETKIQLSTFEMDLLNNAEWVLTKNQIIKKAQRLLEQVQENIFDYMNQSSVKLPKEVLSISPKISKGENYNGLPWLMLDYPRYFNKEKIFAIRTMFWWGNFFSTTIHLSGEYKEKYSHALIHSHEDLCKHDFYICINEDQWQHHFEKENFLPVKNFTAGEFNDTINKKIFTKLSCQLSFLQWNNAPGLLSESFIRIIQWLG